MSSSEFLPLAIAHHDGGAYSDSPSYAIEQALRSDSNCYSSKKQGDVSLVLRAPSGFRFSLRSIRIVNAPSSFTSPMRTGAIFVSDEPIGEEECASVPIMTASDFEERMGRDRSSSPLVPVMYLDLPPHQGLDRTFDAPVEGCYLMIRMFTGLESNIDLTFLGFRGELKPFVSGEISSTVCVRRTRPALKNAQLKEVGLRFFASLLKATDPSGSDVASSIAEQLATHLDAMPSLHMMEDWIPPRAQPTRDVSGLTVTAEGGASGQKAEVVLAGSGNWTGASDSGACSLTFSSDTPFDLASVHVQFKRDHVPNTLAIAVKSEGHIVFTRSVDSVPHELDVPVALPRGTKATSVTLDMAAPSGSSDSSSKPVTVQRVHVCEKDPSALACDPRATIAALESWLARVATDSGSESVRRAAIKALRSLSLRTGTLTSLLLTLRAMVAPGAAAESSVEGADAYLRALAASCLGQEKELVREEEEASKGGAVPGSVGLSEIDATFDPAEHGSGITYYNSNRSIHCTTGSNTHCLVNRGFSSGRALWEFQLDEDTNSQTTCFGAAIKPVTNSSYDHSPQLWMYRAYNGQCYDKGSSKERKCRRVHKGDRVLVELDLDAGTISYTVADEPQGVVFENVSANGGEIFPAVAFYGSGRKVTLLRVEGEVSVGGVPLSDLRLMDHRVGVGELGMGGSLGYPAAEGDEKVGEVTVDRKKQSGALSMHPPAPVASEEDSRAFAVFSLAGTHDVEFETFSAVAALDDSVDVDAIREAGTGVLFEVFADDKLVATAGPITAPQQQQEISVSVAGASVLRLAVRCSSASNTLARAVWLLPTVAPMSDYRKWYRRVLGTAMRPVQADVDRLDSAPAASSSLEAAGRLARVLGSLATSYLGAMRDLSGEPPEDRVAPVGLEAAFALEASGAVFRLLASMLAELTASPPAGPVAEVVAALLRLLQANLRRVHASQVDPAVAGLVAEEESKGDSPRDSIPVSHLKGLLEDLMSGRREVSPDLRVLAADALAAGAPVLENDSKSRAAAVLRAAQQCRVMELQLRWPTVAPGEELDPAFERGLLMTQIACRQRGWRVHVAGDWMAFVFVVVDLSDGASPDDVRAFLEDELSSLLKSAGLKGWSFPDGLNKPLLPIKVEHFAKFDRWQRLFQEPGVGALRLYVGPDTTFDGVCADVSRMEDRICRA